MFSEIIDIVTTMYKNIRKSVFLFGITVIFVSLSGLMGKNGFYFISLIRYIFGNDDEPNLYIILAKVSFIFVYISIGYFIMVLSYKAIINDHKIKVGDFISEIKTNRLKSIALIILCYIPISIIFDYLNYLVLKTLSYLSKPWGYIITSILFMVRYAIIFLSIVAIIERTFKTNEIIIRIRKILLSKITFFFFGTLIVLTIIAILIFNEIVIRLLQIDKTLLPNYLNLVQAYRYRIWLSNLCRIYEAIVTPFIFLYISLNFFYRKNITK